MNGDCTKEIRKFSSAELLSILKKSVKISNCDLLILQMTPMQSIVGNKANKELILTNSNVLKIIIGIYTKENNKIVYEKKKEVSLNDFELNSSIFDETKYLKIMMQKSENPQQYIDNLVDYLKLNNFSNNDIFSKVDVLMESCIAINPVKQQVQNDEEKPVESVYSTFLSMQNGIPFTRIS